MPSTKITTQITSWGITGSTESSLDRDNAGTLWWAQNEGDDTYFWYSLDQGNTWSYSGSASDMDFLSSLYPRSFQIDADGFGHHVGRLFNTQLSYGRGTPGSTGKTWSWKTFAFSGASEALAPDGGLDMVAFKVGSAWKVFITYCTISLSGSTYTNSLRLTRLNVTAANVITVDKTEVLRTTTGQTSFPYGALAFQHTGDGKTSTATPHVYVVTSINTPTTSANRQDDLQLVKLTYDTGLWTTGSPVTLETAVDTTNRTLRVAYDGARVVTAYGTRNRTTGTSSAALHVIDWAESGGTLTRRDPPAYGGGYPLATTMAVDPSSDDIYLVAYGETNGIPTWNRFNRTAATWGTWTAIGTTASGPTPGRVALKRYVASSAIEAVYETGTAAPFTDYYIKLSVVNKAPAVPVLRFPASSITLDIGTNGAVFAWQFTDPDPGDTQSAWQFRRKAGSGAYSYYTLSTQSWGSTAVWNSGNLQALVQGPGVWANGNVWSWSINTQDSSGLISGFAPDNTIIASSAPVVTVTGPAAIYSFDSSPIVQWTYTGGFTQRTYQVKVFDLNTYSGGGFNPATSTPVWDSGETSASQARSVKVGQVLSNGAVYRAYMRVSDTIGVYSDWSGYTEFLLVLTPAPSPLVEAIPDVNPVTGTGRVRLTVQGSTNMLSTSQASDHLDTTQWLNDHFASVGVGTAGVVTGSPRSLSIAASVAGDLRVITYAGAPIIDTTGATPATPRDFPATPGQFYTAVASFTANTTPRNTRVTLRFYDPSDALLLEVKGTPQADLTTGPTLNSVTGQCPVGANRVRLVLEVLATATVGETHFADGIDMHPGTFPVYSPGGLTGTQTFTVTRWVAGAPTVVRTINQAVGDTRQHLIGFDREMPHGVDVSYTAQSVTALSNGQALASDPSTAALVRLDTDAWALRDPNDDNGELPALVTDHKTETTELTAAYHPAGRSRPLVESEGVQGEDGAVTITVTTPADKATVRDLSTRPTTLLLQSPSGDLWYIRVFDRKRTAGSGQSHQFELDYVEVDVP